MAEFDIMYNGGISKIGNILDVGVNEEIVDKSGAWFSYEGQRLGQGRENSKTFLSENPDMAFEIENKIRAKHLLPLAVAPKKVKNDEEVLNVPEEKIIKEKKTKE